MAKLRTRKTLKKDLYFRWLHSDTTDRYYFFIKGNNSILSKELADMKNKKITLRYDQTYIPADIKITEDFDVRNNKIFFPFIFSKAFLTPEWMTIELPF